MTREEPLILQRDGKRLFAVRHDPAADAPAGPAFLFCHPFAEEKKNSHRCCVEIARHMADLGCGALRLDQFGCGDSDGDFGDSTLDTRLADLRAGLTALGEFFPRRERGLLGMRLGASLAAIVAAEDDCVKHLVLIEPILDGKRAFAADLRRMLIKQMMTDGAASADRKEVVARLERGEGSLDFDGYTISAQFYKGLTTLDLGSVAKTAARLLVVQVSPREAILEPLRKLADDCTAAGADVTVRSLAMPPPWNRLETVDSQPFCDTLTAWLVGPPGRGA